MPQAVGGRHPAPFALFRLIQVAPEEQNLWVEYQQLAKTFGQFAMKTVQSPGEIYPVFRELFKKQGVTQKWAWQRLGMAPATCQQQDSYRKGGRKDGRRNEFAVVTPALNACLHTPPPPFSGVKAAEGNTGATTRSLRGRHLSRGKIEASRPMGRVAWTDKIVPHG